MLSFLSAVPLYPLLAAVSMWYAVPLIVSVSLVCAATHHEEFRPIVNHAFRFAGWIVVFMVVVMAILWLMGKLV